MAYQVIDTRTQQVVGTFKNKQAARNKRDRLDAAYGAVRHTVREVAGSEPLTHEGMVRHFRALLAA
jgi:hypothetical protein